MPKLRHIALAAEDPFAAAEFYKQAFDFTEVSRIEKSDDPKKSYGVFLSDGTLSLAVLHFGWDQGPGLDFRGKGNVTKLGHANSRLAVETQDVVVSRP